MRAFLPKTSVLTNEQYGFAKRHFWVHLDQTELNWLSWQSLPWPVEPSCRAWWLFSPLLEKKLCFFSWSCCGLLSVNRIDIFKRKVYSCLDSRIQSLNIKKQVTQSALICWTNAEQISCVCTIIYLCRYKWGAFALKRFRTFLHEVSDI